VRPRAGASLIATARVTQGLKARWATSQSTPMVAQQDNAARPVRRSPAPFIVHVGRDGATSTSTSHGP
jgi:hypothetical protein